MKTVLTLAPILLVLALPAVLPEPVHPNFIRHHPWITAQSSSAFLPVVAQPVEIYAVIASGKTEINWARAEQRLEACNRIDYVPNDCAIVRLMISVRDRTWETLP